MLNKIAAIAQSCGWISIWPSLGELISVIGTFQRSMSLVTDTECSRYNIMKLIGQCKEITELNVSFKSTKKRESWCQLLVPAVWSVYGLFYSASNPSFFFFVQIDFLPLIPILTKMLQFLQIILLSIMKERRIRRKKKKKGRRQRRSRRQWFISR